MYSSFRIDSIPIGPVVVELLYKGRWARSAPFLNVVYSLRLLTFVDRVSMVHLRYSTP